MSDKVVEVITGRDRRRRWSIEDKLRIVAETHEPGACVRQVAASNDVYPALLFTWRRQVRDGKLVPPGAQMFLPVRTADRAASDLPDVGGKPSGRTAGQIEIELRDGSRVRVDADVSLASLRRVITALRG